MKTTFTTEDYYWQGVPLRGLCGHCQIHVDSTDPNHRVTSIVEGGRGVECVLRGDIEAKDGGPLRPTDPGPSAACWEYQAGELPIRLPFSIKVF